jgi:hypothetical protein
MKTNIAMVENAKIIKRNIFHSSYIVLDGRNERERERKELFTEKLIPFSDDSHHVRRRFLLEAMSLKREEKTFLLTTFFFPSHSGLEFKNGDFSSFILHTLAVHAKWDE